MQVTKNIEGDTLNVGLEGRLDTKTAPELESQLEADLKEVSNVVMDFTDLAYISSAGLRLLLSIQKTMTAKGGSLRITNASDAVMDVFDVTGFTRILTIE